MSHFYADIQGNRGEATRGGSKASGMQGHIRGWNVGVRVSCYYDEERDEDRVRVTLTSGSSYCGRSKSLGNFSAEDLDA